MAASVAAPEHETPEEETTVEPYRLTPKLARRVTIIGALLLIGFAALVLRLWTLQVLAGSQYAARATANQVRMVPVQAPRGTIVDRNGDVLVTNAAVTSVELWPSSLPKQVARRASELKALARVTRVRLHAIRKQIVALEQANDQLDPVVVRAQAPAPLVTFLEERSSEFPGVALQHSYVRRYPHGPLAPQLLGYVSQVSPQELKKLGTQGYPGEEIGQSGVEHAFNSYLEGIAGSAHVRVDSFGRPRSARTLVKPPQAGQTVQLTLDTGLQLSAENALQYGIQLAHANGQWAADGGAIVAMDPKTGAILAMASAPTYNPSVFSGRVTEKKLNAAGLGSPKSALDHNYPVLNRALAATYPPGSSFKPLTAIAAMQQGFLNPYALLPCTGTYVAPEDRAHRVWHNWDPNVNQGMNLPIALAYSCDTYFYRLGNDFWLLPAKYGQPEQNWAKAFGFGAPTGIDIGGEADNSLVPTIQWRHQTFTRKTDRCCWQVDRLWKPGDSIQLAIGQGDLLVTPLQMARFYSAIANGGKLVSPHVLMDVQNPNNTIVPTPAPPSPRPIPGLDPANLKVVQQGLYMGTHMSFGTSYGVFGNFPVPIAGKTGTAQKVVTLPGLIREESQSWWCGYGPANDPKTAPKLVVCAVIENGGEGGAAAAPAAEKVFAKFFHVQAGQTGYIHSD